MISDESETTDGVRVIRTNAEDRVGAIPFIVLAGALTAASAVSQPAGGIVMVIFGYCFLLLDIPALRRRLRETHEALEAVSELPSDAVTVAPATRVIRWSLSPRRYTLYVCWVVLIGFGYVIDGPSIGYATAAGWVLATLTFQASTVPTTLRWQKGHDADLYEPADNNTQTVFLTKTRV